MKFPLQSTVTIGKYETDTCHIAPPDDLFDPCSKVGHGDCGVSRCVCLAVVSVHDPGRRPATNQGE